MKNKSILFAAFLAVGVCLALTVNVSPPGQSPCTELVVCDNIATLHVPAVQAFTLANTFDSLKAEAVLLVCDSPVVIGSTVVERVNRVTLRPFQVNAPLVLRV
jgi:hypothetical protein